MAYLTYRTAGESHGQKLIALIEGMPAGVVLDLDMINGQMRRRQGGYGRGGRMAIEKDKVNILSGIRKNVTIGSPIAIEIANKDWRIDQAPAIHRPRPGHADLAGSLKWLTTDCRETLERASARETAARVACGAVARCLLSDFGIKVVGFVRQIYNVQATIDPAWTPDELATQRDANEAYCPDALVVDDMIAAIRQAKIDKETLGGIVEVQVHGHPPGLGSCVRWQDKLDGRLMQAVGAIQAFKGVEIGMGFGVAEHRGSDVHDEIGFDSSRRHTPSLGFTRSRNNAGGLEGGMTNGQPIVVRAAMKPISTLLKGMQSVNLETKQPERSDYERSDVCSVPAASVIAENVVAFEVAKAFLEKFGGDTLREIRTAYDSYLDAARSLGIVPGDKT
ncbi:MAG: chorismate synthase [Planctomycetes bacterium]|nr:chorismate synthase [Planctomycetota bacterium]